MAPRYDDLACVFAGVKGIVGERSERYIDVLAVFDNEEVGSLTRQGADSTFFRDTLENIADGLGVCANIHRTWKADSFMLSADNAHACHPNQGGKADLTNRPYLNRGVVLKYHGGQKYATDACSAAYVRSLCGRNDIPLQTYANRVVRRLEISRWRRCPWLQRTSDCPSLPCTPRTRRAEQEI